jgi:signal transduction histidine kinase
VPTPLTAEAIPAAAEHGRICARASRGQRDLQDIALAHPALFPNPPFDATLFSSVAMAMAFSAPWCTQEHLRVANRAVLFGFVADWQIDYVAKSTREVDAVLTGCLAVADGDPANTPIGQLLADIRDELATVPGFAAGHRVWREELERMLVGMAREWTWKSAGTRPTLDEYLTNADNLGSSFVNVSHWLRTSDAAARVRLADLTAVGREEQRVLRLVNDLATYERDLRWGDLNALMLVADRDELTRRCAALLDRCQELLQPLAGHCPSEVDYLQRQIGFASGFYQLADFWGDT